jgi:hypothetical protein
MSVIRTDARQFISKQQYVWGNLEEETIRQMGHPILCVSCASIHAQSLRQALADETGNTY